MLVQVFSLLWDTAFYITLFLIPIALYPIFVKKNNERSPYSNRDWFYLVKLYFAKRAIKGYQEKGAQSDQELNYLEQIMAIKSQQFTDSHFIYGVDQKGNSLSLRFVLRAGPLAEVTLCLRIAATGALYTFPESDTVKLCSTSSYSWKVKDLQIEVLEPFNRLRITYNGLLQNTHKNGDAEHVQFHFIWKSGSAPRFIPRDLSHSLLADSLASQKWRDGDWISTLGDEEGYEQFGALRGFVRGDFFVDDLHLNLPSCRTRFWGTSERRAVKRSVHVFVAAKSGILFSLWAKSLRAGCSQLRYGNIILGNGNTYPIDQSDIRLQFLARKGFIPQMFILHIQANKREYKCVLHLKADQLTIKNQEQEGYVLHNVPAESDLDSQQAHSLVNFWYSSEGTGQSLPSPIISPLEGTNLSKSYVINLESTSAKMTALAGGKGSSLALLSSLHSSDFTVPKGFVVTVDAFNDQLQSNFRLRTAVSMLDDICCKRAIGHLELACTETVELFKGEEIIPEVVQAVMEELQKVASGEGGSSVARWAVRSSGINEDCEDLSAAGQNETFLGCTTPQDIVRSIASCWASLFTYQSIQYRHQHGLPVKSSMAVVIQRMVPADSAGVLFTSHPSTTNPAQMVITANFGLGESVVSGQSEPDTVILKRSWDGSLEVESKTLGSKTKIIKMADDSGVREDNREMLQKFCIDDKQSLLLGKVGVFLEEIFGGARDIEWAFYQDRLYLLQARPITTLNYWTDYELTHELDIALLTEDAIFTRANSGEVFPGASTTLTQTTIALVVDRALQLSVYYEVIRYIQRALGTFHHHVFIDVILSMYMYPSKTIDVGTKVLDLAIFGHQVINEIINELAVQRHGGLRTPGKLLKQIFQAVSYVWISEASLKKYKSKARTLEIGIGDKDTIIEMYDKINKYIEDMPQIVKFHGIISGASVFYQIVALNTLLEGKTEFTMEHYTDMALLLSSCNDIISSEIPTTLEEIARALVQRGQLQAFAKIDPNTGQEWLQSNSPEVFKLFQNLLNDHGHRVLGEFDLINVPWATDPTQVIKMIQANRHHKNDSKAPKVKKSVDEIVDELVSIKSNITRRVLKWVMKRCRRAVARREESKSETIRMVDKVRIAYNHLAHHMVLEGLLPSEDLIFHLTHYEVEQIVRRSAGTSVFITKAFRRQRLYPKWNKLVFPELSFATPEPERNDIIIRGSGDILCRGTPVCSGIVKARACVILNLDEIHQLQNGDILITYCTDIGWSPYFPMLSGIVTELGGLVSHGAVVAREYGLPSIVGVKGVTKLFKTGDIVVLSGKMGTVELAVSA